jgi:hypothetical protein
LRLRAYRKNILPVTRLPALARAAQPKVDLDALFQRNRGLATRRQLLACGLDDDAIRRELRDHRWQRVLPGLYANFTGQLGLEHRRIAATLFTAQDAQITGLSALAYHGFQHISQDQYIHVLVRHEVRRTSRRFVRVHRTHRLDAQATRLQGYSICTVPRAVADACRRINDLRDVRAIVAESVQRRLTTPAALATELAYAGNSFTAMLRKAVEEIARGARSGPEADLQSALSSSEVLPSPLWNPQLATAEGVTLPTPDGYIDETAIAIEVDSREYHLSPEDWQKTMRRGNLLSEQGILVLHFTPSEIRTSPRRVRETVEKAHRQRLSSPPVVTVVVKSRAQPI